ncbi:MAG TPA: T9SS type A sorting domain-containing protein [Flavobacterium sp.]|nr:T9SS type A sorting domain-containing protein [Flavobacterium sp.]
MNRILLLLLVLLSVLNSHAQAPEITGDTMMCPWTNGTASVVNNTTYDSYQWYYKYWFTSDPYVAIDGATGSSFTYDWYTYDQALLKVVTTLNGVTYESNVLQIDSYAWTSLFVSYDLGENAQYDPDTDSISLCEGTSLVLSINNPPYNANITWSVDGVPMADETGSSFVVTQAGTYEVSAAPGFCPDNSSNSLPITVTINQNCSMSVPENSVSVAVYPNPADNYISFTSNNTITFYEVADVTGKVVLQGPTTEGDKIEISGLSTGLYLLKLKGETISSVHKIVKK